MVWMDLVFMHNGRCSCAQREEFVCTMGGVVCRTGGVRLHIGRLLVHQGRRSVHNERVHFDKEKG